MTYSYDISNRMVSGTNGSDSFAYEYDDNGNMLSVSKNGVKTREFVYNKINNLVSSTVDGVMTEYTYHGDRLRETKTTNGVTTRHIYDGTDIVADVSSGETTNYVRGVGLIYSENMATGEKRRYDLNAHGDVVKRKNADGTAEKFNYRAYGKAAAGTPDPFGYCGEYTDSETGMVYLRNRYYDPDMGRFINVDPIYSGANWYAYCSGNPINRIDPLGLFDYNSILGTGSRGNDVRVLQNELAWLGYYNDSIDGVFGKNTMSAVKAYQRSAGLDIDGIVGLNTWRSMGLTYRSSADIDAGIEIATWGLKQYKDVTVAINRALDANVGSFAANKRNPLWFYEKVASKRAWDIKLPKSWESTIAAGTYPGSISTPVIYKSMLTNPEGLGNITYGYLGTAAGFSETELLAGGDAAAGGVNLDSLSGIWRGINGVIRKADSEDDKGNIRRGIVWYWKR